MPIRLGKIPNTGAIAFLHTCENCGEYACFGIGVSYRKALNAIEEGRIELGKELLGKWYCLEHWKVLNEIKIQPKRTERPPTDKDCRF